MEALNKLRKLYDGESCKSSWLTRFNWLMTVGLRDKLDKAKRPAVMVHLQKHLTVLLRPTLLKFKSLARINSCSPFPGSRLESPKETEL